MCLQWAMFQRMQGRGVHRRWAFRAATFGCSFRWRVIAATTFLLTSHYASQGRHGLGEPESLLDATFSSQIPAPYEEPGRLQKPLEYEKEMPNTYFGASFRMSQVRIRNRQNPLLV